MQVGARSPGTATHAHFPGISCLASDVVSSDELAVPLPDCGRVVTHWPIPIVVQRGALALVGLIVALAAAFALIYCVAAGRDFPNLGDVLWGWLRA